MSKKKSDDLFILIHTLSKSEKRYLNVFISPTQIKNTLNCLISLITKRNLMMMQY